MRSKGASFAAAAGQHLDMVAKSMLLLPLLLALSSYKVALVLAFCRVAQSAHPLAYDGTVTDGVAREGGVTQRGPARVSEGMHNACNCLLYHHFPPQECGSYSPMWSVLLCSLRRACCITFSPSS